MQIRRIYKNIKPELLFDELKDLLVKQGTEVENSKMETYSLPDDSSSFISRGTITLQISASPDKPAEVCFRGHIIGSARGETKLLLDINQDLLSEDKIRELQNDLDFMLGSYESNKD
jgi:hypothetical protein